ncbi:MAG: hypothetical protein WC381_06635 [Kiritimatiellia bacterium]|jgi:hypothetical protein
MVLGILSVMVIMAVAFAISMRTERVAAGNYADSVRARQLAQAGLARALSDLANQLGTNGLGSAGGGTNYPPWSVTNSYTTEYTNTSAASKLSLLTGEATNFVPRALWGAAMTADSHFDADKQWLALKSFEYDTNGVPVKTNLMGRVKYLILNCSGLLDANFVGGAARGIGTNPMEIAINNMPEMTDYSGFINNRANNYRYEMQEELAELNTNYFFNFTVYSRALPGYWDTNFPPGVGTQVNLSGSAAQLAGRMDKITNAFVHAGFSPFAAGVLYSNLIDYVDDDFVPSNFEYCVENVPMINEVVVSNGVEVSAGSDAAHRSYKVFTDVYVECWYPFVTGAVASFSLNVTNKFPGAVGFQHSDYIANITPLNSAAGSVPVKYLCCQYIGVSFDWPTVNSITLTTTIDPKVQWGGNNVDALKNPIVLTTTHDGNTYPARDNKAASLECLDPRFNYDPADSRQWRPRAILPENATNADPNPWTTGWWPTNLIGDVDSEMYVAGDRLRSVAELGYLVYNPNEPWKTVKLYGSTPYRVLDVFGLSTNTSDVLMTNTVYRGVVNCNPNVATDATAVVFAGMPVDQYPGGSHSNTVMDGARALVSRIYFGGFCTNLSDIGRGLNQGDLPGATELERESYFRNSVNLLNVRQNLFTIIIEADVASGGNIPSNPVKQRAVALVWRDPYTGEMFVRSIKWLKD